MNKLLFALLMFLLLVFQVPHITLATEVKSRYLMLNPERVNENETPLCVN